MVVGGRGRRGRDSEPPAPRTGSLAAVSLSHTGWGLESERDIRHKRNKMVKVSIRFSSRSIPLMKVNPPDLSEGGSLKLWERDGRAVNTSIRMSAGEMAGTRSHGGSWAWDWMGTRDEEGREGRERSRWEVGREKTKEEEVSLFSIIHEQQL